MQLTDLIPTFNAIMKERYGRKVYRLPVDAGFTCPNRDGARGKGGCIYCNNRSFSPFVAQNLDIPVQIQAGKDRLTGQQNPLYYLAYFQAYTNTYAPIDTLKERYDLALAQPDIIGLVVATRPDTLPESVLDLLCTYRDQGLEVWIDLGLQSSRDDTLQRINRLHTFAEYQDACERARKRALQVCTHLMVGLPGEDFGDYLNSIRSVINVGVDGLKIHPLLVVKGTPLAESWKRGEFEPPTLEQYVEAATAMILETPLDIPFHRLTSSAPYPMLLAPDWCRRRVQVFTALTRSLVEAGRKPIHLL